MFVRAEKRSWSVYGKSLSPGDCVEISEEQLAGIQRLIDSGDLSLHQRDPSPKNVEPPKVEPVQPEPVKVEPKEAVAEEAPKEEAPKKEAAKKPAAKKTTRRRRRTKKES